MEILQSLASRSELKYLFLTGMRFSLELTIVATLMGMLFGTCLAVARVAQIRVFSNMAALYVNAMRSIPLLLVIFWIYFLAPYLLGWVSRSAQPVQVGGYTSAMVTFVLFESAFFCEIMRAGIGSVKKTQIQAAFALGMNYRQAMILVVLPQALRNMSPAILSQIVVLFQDTSLVYVLSLTDFFGAASELGARDGRVVELYIFAAAVYLVICVTASGGVKYLQRKVSF
ncbi:amino acid ABC transporter permease [Variovorax sp. J22G21]|uniref:amino acid ABC transporter permease n=1 Tax=Variovorax fucosicus TaxID=3053517 RepID=UPI00257695EA|nr:MULTISPECIES: amino acid ABC transporter permease [unclassified Variovorax]MDM0041319.1 amino acid ABC transporter permease [Variovorax sp. J22R193]MDM0060376.1 amino acid ABC transporter permease [Variovorax sp. J22G21]